MPWHTMALNISSTGPDPLCNKPSYCGYHRRPVSNMSNDSSFPSGHACNAFMIAALFAERLRRKRYILYGLAGVVALSRILSRRRLPQRRDHGRLSRFGYYLVHVVLSTTKK